MNITKKITAKLVREYLLIVLGSCIYGVGLIIFIKPAHIPMGGIAGISLLLNYLFMLPVGVMNIVLNIPLYFIGYKILGSEFFYKTLVSTIVSSLFIDLASPFLPIYSGNMLLATLYGGIIMGAGFGLVFRAGGTSGGTDVVAKYLYRKKDIPLGNTNMVANGIIIAISAVIYKSVESALYAIIVTYLTGLVIDKMISGADIQKNAFIITTKPNEVSHIIMETLHHGVTALEAKGMYTGERKTVLLCTVRRHETSTLKKLIGAADDTAFAMLYDVDEVFGQGFKKYIE